MGKFSGPDIPDEPEPIPPPAKQVELAGEEVRKRKAAEKKRKTRAATILSNVTEEEAQQALLGRPGGVIPKNQIGQSDNRP